MSAMPSRTAPAAPQMTRVGTVEPVKARPSLPPTAAEPASAATTVRADVARLPDETPVAVSEWCRGRWPAA